MIEPRVLDEDAIAELSAQMRRPEQRRADLRAQLAAGRAGVRRLQSCSSGSAPTRCRRRSTRCSTTPSDGRAPVWRRSTTAVARRRDVLEARERRPRDRARGDGRGRRADARFHRLGADQHAGNLNCPAGGHPLGLLFRAAGADRSRHPAERRRIPSGDRDRTRGVAAARPRAGRRPSPMRRRSSAATSRPPRASPTSCCGVRARARSGDDEQRHARRRGHRLLRDDRRRSGRLRRRRRSRAPSTSRCPTRSTRRSRRSSWSFRCGSSSTSLRRGSGGAGEHRGGDGVIRELEALTDLRYSLITERRRHASARRRRRRRRRRRTQPARRSRRSSRSRSGCSDGGQRLRIETPGGGGYGSPEA